MDINLPNQAGTDREFVSIQLVLNHLQLRQDGHYVQEFVMSTQSPVEVLGALAQYYGESHVLATPQALSIIQQAPQHQACAYVYVTPENIQVIMDADDWAALCERFPTQFGTCDLLAREVSRAMAAQINQSGSYGKLYILGMDAEVAEAPEQMIPASAFDAAVKKAVAEALAGQAGSVKAPPRGAKKA